ncbi:MAG: HsdR family type I site-specific deoxyribonuclease, partial [Candidatus Diapherotrites archaeon]|nr:HsdR family type I site-specific deoxyribonuclease [Candidatus Diapherotrites archaeon]
MAKLGTERGSVQNPMIKYACEIGWEYIKPEEVERLRGGRTGLLLKEIFKNQVLQINSDFIDNLMIEELIKKIEKLPVNIEGNLTAWEYLKGIKTVFVPNEKRERNVKLIDEQPKNNIFQVTDEYSFTNGKFTNRYDVVFFINGVPLFFVETKSAHKLGGMSEALDQVRRYHKETPEAMALFQIYTLTHLIQFYYSATWNFSMKSLFSWKAETGSIEYEKLVKDFFGKKRVIETALDYILFTRKDDEIQKVILRPHQMRAIQKVVERVANKKKKRGLIWHTQGSGKTYTMIVAAQKIIENSLFENPTVIMLVDRNELETQLFGNLSSIGFEHIHIAESKKNLKELLESDTRGLIVTMIHKFENMPAEINERNNIFVLVDEAHRTTGGDLGNYLMGALPNATYIGFTGTPIDKTSHGRGTFITFGKDDAPNGYLDKYGIAESIRDGTTIKLHYSLASNEL